MRIARPGSALVTREVPHRIPRSDGGLGISPWSAHGCCDFAQHDGVGLMGDLVFNRIEQPPYLTSTGVALSQKRCLDNRSNSLAFFDGRTGFNHLGEGATMVSDDGHLHLHGFEYADGFTFGNRVAVGFLPGFHYTVHR